MQSSSPESWRRRRKGLDSMIIRHAQTPINHFLALEHTMGQVGVGFDPGLWCSQPICVSTRPPSPRSTCLIPQIHPFSRIWLSLSMVGVSCDCTTSVVVSSQRRSSPAAAGFRDIIAISHCRLLWRHHHRLVSLFQGGYHLSSSWLLFSTWHLLASLWGTFTVNSFSSPELASSSDAVTLENFDPQITACYIVSIWGKIEAFLRFSI